MNEAIREWVRTVLRLPRGSPSLPAADPAELRVVDPAPDYLRYSLLWYWVALCTTGPILLLTEVAGIIGASHARSGAFALIAVPLAVAILLATAAGFWFRFFTVTLEVEMLRYAFSDRAMRLRRGVMHIEEVTISYANIQNIRMLQGPIQRIYGLADLVVDTAGGGARLPAGNPEMDGLTGHRGLIKGIAEPEKLRDWLLERMRRCRGAGLGDAGDHAPPESAAHPPSTAALPPAALERLAAIRDQLRAANAALAGR